MLLKVGIPKDLVSECNFGWRSVTYHFGVSLTLSSYLDCRVPLGFAEWCIPFMVTLTLTLKSGLISRFFVSEAYLLYYS